MWLLKGVQELCNFLLITVWKDFAGGGAIAEKLPFRSTLGYFDRFTERQRADSAVS